MVVELTAIYQTYPHYQKNLKESLKKYMPISLIRLLDYAMPDIKVLLSAPN